MGKDVATCTANFPPRQIWVPSPHQNVHSIWWMSTINSICCNKLYFRIAGNESRIAAFDLLVVLAENCPENLKQIGTQLIKMHHQPDPATAKEWEVRMCRMKYSALCQTDFVIHTAYVHCTYTYKFPGADPKVLFNTVPLWLLQIGVATPPGATTQYSNCWVPSAYPYRYSSTVLYETFVASQRNLDVYMYQGNFKGESVVAAILPSRMKGSYCASGFFRS